VRRDVSQRDSVLFAAPTSAAASEREIPAASLTALAAPLFSSLLRREIRVLFITSPRLRPSGTDTNGFPLTAATAKGTGPGRLTFGRQEGKMCCVPRKANRADVYKEFPFFVTVKDGRGRIIRREDLRAQKDWRKWLRGEYGVTREQVDFLWRRWYYSPSRSRMTVLHDKLGSVSPTPRAAERAWRLWSLRVLAIRVEFLPGARARLREPRASYCVELRWEEAEPRSFVLKRLQVVPDDLLGDDEIELYEYLSAFMVRVAELPSGHVFATSAPVAEPRPGQPPKFEYYRRLLDDYMALIAEGVKNPAAVLAEERGVNRSTMKSRLWRARRFGKSVPDSQQAPDRRR